MLLNLQAVRPEIRQRLKTACMAVAGLTALYLSIQPLRQAKEFRNQEMTGLGAVPEETLPETVVRKITLRNGVGEALAEAFAAAIRLGRPTRCSKRRSCLPRRSRRTNESLSEPAVSNW